MTYAPLDERDFPCVGKDLVDKNKNMCARTNSAAKLKGNVVFGCSNCAVSSSLKDIEVVSRAGVH